LAGRQQRGRISGPVVVQLVGLGVTILAALRRLGPAFAAVVMVAAHVGATLLAYALLLVVTGDADGAHNRSYDYGVSAVWLGLLGALGVSVVPAVRGDRVREVGLVSVAIAIVLAGVLFFPLMAALEHALAFALGAAIAAITARRQAAGRSARSGASTASGRAGAA
jgi:hypothetical protein